MIIYKTTNLVNNKIYIGQDSKNNSEYLGSGVLIKKAIKKYGRDSFKKDIIEYCKNKEELDKREIYWIEKLNVIKEGYNIAEGGNGSLGYRHSEETKQYLRKLNLGKKQSEETKGKRNIKLKNKKRFKKTKENISKGRKMYCSIKENCPMFGKKHTEESKLKMSNSSIGKNKGKKRTEKFKKERSKKYSNNGNPMFGKKHTEESKLKMSQLKCKKILQFDLDNNYIAEFNSVKEAKEKTGISHIISVLKNRKLSVRGYKFIYKKDYADK